MCLGHVAFQGQHGPPCLARVRQMQYIKERCMPSCHSYPSKLMETQSLTGSQYDCDLSYHPAIGMYIAPPAGCYRCPKMSPVPPSFPLHSRGHCIAPSGNIRQVVETLALVTALTSQSCLYVGTAITPRLPVEMDHINSFSSRHALKGTEALSLINTLCSKDS